MKRPRNERLSSVKLSVEEYETMNFLEDDDKDDSPFIQLADDKNSDADENEIEDDSIQNDYEDELF